MISLVEPNLVGRELKYLNNCIKNNYVSSIGNYVSKFEKSVSKFLKVKYCISCTSGTTSLQLALRVLGVSAGHEVIVPTITFIAPINSVIYNSACPVFMDVDENFNIDPIKTIKFIEKETYFKDKFTYNKKTGKKILAIIIVHCFGNAANVFDLVKICKMRNIRIVEDAAESLGTYYNKGYLKNKYTGTIGDIGCLSFNGNKIITSGGGGMLVTNNYKYAKKAKYLSTQAFNDKSFYIHNEVGYNFRLSNVCSAIGLAQLENINYFIKKKKKIRLFYLEQINKKIKDFEIVAEPSYSNNNNWLNVVKIKKNFFDKKKLKNLILKFKRFGIQVRAIWHPNHLQRPYRKFQKYEVAIKSKNISKYLCIPSSTNLNQKKLNKVISVLIK